MHFCREAWVGALSELKGGAVLMESEGVFRSLLHTAQVSAPRGEGSEGPRRVRRVQSLPSSLSDDEVVVINIYLSNRDLEQALLLKH
jgi:hypothetical protein